MNLDRAGRVRLVTIVVLAVVFVFTGLAWIVSALVMAAAIDVIVLVVARDDDREGRLAAWHRRFCSDWV